MFGKTFKFGNGLDIFVYAVGSIRLFDIGLSIFVRRDYIFLNIGLGMVQLHIGYDYTNPSLISD